MLYGDIVDNKWSKYLFALLFSSLGIIIIFQYKKLNSFLQAESYFDILKNQANFPTPATKIIIFLLILTNLNKNTIFPIIILQ